jgi:hypothetical protein
MLAGDPLHMPQIPRLIFCQSQRWHARNSGVKKETKRKWFVFIFVWIWSRNVFFVLSLVGGKTLMYTGVVIDFFFFFFPCPLSC